MHVFYRCVYIYFCLFFTILGSCFVALFKNFIHSIFAFGMLGIILGTGDRSVNIAKIPALMKFVSERGRLLMTYLEILHASNILFKGCLVFSCMSLTLFDPLLDI